MKKVFIAIAITLAITSAAWSQDVPTRDEGPSRPVVIPEPPSLPVSGTAWVSHGPSPTNGGQTEGIVNSPVIGAIQTIVAHPQTADTLWIGAVNGGIWKTTNATSATPTWTAMGDAFSSLSIGAMGLDPTDGTFNTIVAGFGRFSSFGGVGGPRSGLLRTTNGGTNWTALTPATLIGKNISGIAARGGTIVVSVNFADSFTCGNIGIFRSTDTGGSFAIVSGAGGSGLPLGRAFDLAVDPTNNAVLYTAIRDAGVCGAGVNGVYKSIDTGATWTKVSNPTMDALMTDAAGHNNTRIAVGLSGEIYAGIMNTGQMAGLFRSGTGGSSWTQLDTPKTNEGGTDIGIHPRMKPGSQGGTHFSIVADPTDANIVYVGGDRQPSPFTNSIGADNFAGRIFRVNATSNPGSQATSLTNCAVATAACNGTVSTSSDSSPHADSRRMIFDGAGNLLESDDGGIYRRTNPRTTGDWFSVNGTLRVTEIHDVAWDRVSNMIVSGNQDTGTSEQTTVGGTTWSQVSQGDGGDVSVDDTSSGTQSTRYTSFQNLGSLRRRIMNASGTATSTVFPALTVLSGGPAFVGQFATPVEINNVDPARLLIAGFNDLYESLDRGDTITALAFNRTATAIVSGGESTGIDNVNLIYAIATTGLNAGGPNVFVRTAGSGAPLQTATSPGTTALRDVAVDPADWQKAYVINSTGEVWSTPNAGATWTNITGNLSSGATDLRSIIVVPGTPSLLAVGGVNGVFRMATDATGVWSQWGSGLSNAPVWDLDYDAVDDTLIAGTMGRGAWKLNPVVVVGPLPELTINDVAVAEGNAGTTNASFTVTLNPASAGTVTVNYATAEGTATVGTAPFTNASGITINTSGNATPYPSTITVSGVTGTVTKVTATLNSFGHNYTSDVDILLVGPGGQSVVLMSDVAEGQNSSGLTITFDDAASPMPGSGSLGSTSYSPTNIDDGEGGDTYSAPAPGSGYGSAMSVFNSVSPNGVWSLYVVDDFPGDGGSITGGWTLNITTTGDYNSTSGTLTFGPGVTTQPVVVTVNGDQNVEANETFFVNLSGATNAAILDAQGQGTITNDDGVVLAAPTNVVATATTTTNVNITWTAAVGAASYRVYRSSGGGFSLVGSPVTNSFNDPTAVASTAYLYKVRSFAGSESGDSNIDLATTVIFTDPAIATGTTRAKLAHFTELLTAVNAVRTHAGLGAASFTAPTPTTAVTIRRQHVLDLRTALDAARSALSLSAMAYTDPTITAGTTKIKNAHVTDLRNGVK
jgi:subtilisin-like proprotein convertase family protein